MTPGQVERRYESRTNGSLEQLGLRAETFSPVFALADSPAALKLERREGETVTSTKGFALTDMDNPYCIYYVFVVERADLPKRAICFPNPDYQIEIEFSDEDGTLYAERGVAGKATELEASEILHGFASSLNDSRFQLVPKPVLLTRDEGFRTILSNFGEGWLIDGQTPLSQLPGITK